MASSQESFDAGKMRREIFQARNRNIKMVIQFVAETAKILQNKRRKNDFEYIVDRSIELLQRNLMFKELMLLSVIRKCGGNGECREMLKYYIELEKLLSNSVEEKSLRMTILHRIAEMYINTSHYSKTIEYTLRAEKIADELKDKSGKAECCEKLGNARLRLAEYEKAIHYHNKGLEISTEIGDRSGIASNNGNLGTAYNSLGQYEKAIEYYNKGLEISTEIGDRSGIASNNGNLGNAYRCLGSMKKLLSIIIKVLN